MHTASLLLQAAASDAPAADTTATLVAIVILVLTIAAMWRVFQRAGQPGWAVVVPIYNAVVLMRVARLSAWWVLLLVVPLVNLVVLLVAAVGVAHRFERSAAFGFGLWLLPFVFYPLLALDVGRGTAPATA